MTGIKKIFHYSLLKRTVSDIGWEHLQSSPSMEGPQLFESLNLSQEFYSPAIFSFFFSPLNEVNDDRKKLQALIEDCILRSLN